MMVFKAPPAAPWKMEEKLQLMKAYLGEKDWTARSANLTKSFARRDKNFFTPVNCKKEFDRIMNEPCPSNEPASSGSVYNQMAHVQKWMNYFTMEMNAEEALSAELYLVNIRKKTAILDRINDLSPQELEELLAAARLEDEERGDDQGIYRVYHKKIVSHRKEQAGAEQSAAKTVDSENDNVLPPTRIADEQPHGFDTAFCSPSVASAELIISTERLGSPFKSPIRSVATSVREAMADLPNQLEAFDAELADEQDEVGSNFDFTSEPNAYKFDDEISNLSEPRTPTLQVLKSPLYEKAASQPSTPNSEKRGRGRPAKPRASVVATPNVPETVFEEDLKLESSHKADTVVAEPEHVTPRIEPRKETSTGGKTSRRPTVDSPLATPNTRAKKVKEEETNSVDDDERSSVSRKTDIAQPSPDVRDTKPSIPRAISIQTDLSIQGPLLVHKEEKKDNRRPSVSRKSTRRSDAVEESRQATRDYTTQTTKVEIEKDDKIFIRWHESEERPFIRKVDLENLKVEDMSDDDMPLHSLKRSHFVSYDDDGEPEEKQRKGTSRRDILITVDTTDDVAFGLVNQMGYSLTDPTSSSPAKRTRKDDKSKDQSSALMRQLLLNAWNVAIDHRHSSIFATPVSDKDVQGYSEAVKRKTDLTTIKREIESGIIRTPTELKHRLYLMFANAVMFNGTGHDVNTYAREMFDDVMPSVTRLLMCNQGESSQTRVTRLHGEPYGSRVHSRLSMRSESLSVKGFATPFTHTPSSTAHPTPVPTPLPPEEVKRKHRKPATSRKIYSRVPTANEVIFVRKDPDL